MVSIKFCTLSLCIARGFVVFSSAMTTSYQEVLVLQKIWQKP